MKNWLDDIPVPQHVTSERAMQLRMNVKTQFELLELSWPMSDKATFAAFLLDRAKEAFQ